MTSLGEDDKEFEALITSPPEITEKCPCSLDKEAVWYCKSCKHSLCETCDAQIHSFHVIFKSHERVKAPIMSLDCSEHKEESVRFFCLSCNKSICRDCKDSLLGKHSLHQLVTLADAVEDMNDKVNANMTKALKAFEKYSLELDKLSKKASDQFVFESDFFAKREKAFKLLCSSAAKEQENLALIDQRFKNDLEKLQVVKTQRQNPVEYFAVAEQCKSRFDNAIQRYVNHSKLINDSLQTLNQRCEGYGLTLTTDANSVKWDGISLKISSSLATLFESSILNEDQQKRLSEWFDKGVKATLLYRASRDGFAAANFHGKCDDRGATLTVIQAATAHVFGGYASQSWNCVGNRWMNAEGSWLFTLTQSEPSKFASKQGNPFHLRGNRSYGPWFGAGYDLIVHTNSNSNETSCSTIGSSYDANGRDGATALCGAHTFKAVEIEVFQIQ
eukprot:TRINITY_DN11715_c0_g1_i1.p1 TRINITY_DN11715_c0_g1~~TRINITY_DN11715_c0_g1_i1.p1  ORF type:complete len:464 (-),score=116.97 TRINITY_DN11715_c0_g1_i1:63-1397(-)